MRFCDILCARVRRASKRRRHIQFSADYTRCGGFGARDDKRRILHLRRASAEGGNSRLQRGGRMVGAVRCGAGSRVRRGMRNFDEALLQAQGGKRRYVRRRFIYSVRGFQTVLIFR